MHPHRSSSSFRISGRTPIRRWAAIVCLVAASFAANACGSDASTGSSGSSGSSGPPATEPADTATADTSSVEPASTSAAATSAAPAEEPDAFPIDGAAVPDDLCATVPSLDVLNGFVSAAEPLTTIEELPRTPGEAICDVTGDSASNIQFSVLTMTTRASMEEVAANVGATLVDLSDPALPDGFGYSAVAAIVVGDTYYAVQVIDMDVIMDSTNPQWITRSAELLKLWLPMLGVTP